MATIEIDDSWAIVGDGPNKFLGRVLIPTDETADPEAETIPAPPDSGEELPDGGPPPVVRLCPVYHWITISNRDQEGRIGFVHGAFPLEGMTSDEAFCDVAWTSFTSLAGLTAQDKARVGRLVQQAEAFKMEIRAQQSGIQLARGGGR